MLVYKNLVSLKEIKAFSPSQSSELNNCPTKYGLNRILGYKAYPRTAKQEMGSALEVAVRTWQEVQGSSLIGTFEASWERLKNADLKYPDETTWEDFLAYGREVLKVLKVVWPTLGIKNPTFYTWQSRLEDKNLVGDIPLATIPDCIDWPDPSDEFGEGRRVIDMKASDKPFREEPRGIASMDEQLRSYAWRCEAERVAFLVFVYSVGRPKKGDTVTCLTDGRCGKVVESVNKNESTALVKFKTSEPARINLIDLSKSRIQFIEAKVTPEQIESTIQFHRERAIEATGRWSVFEQLLKPIQERKDLTAKQYDDAVLAALFKAYPQQPGMRFPNDKCSWCEMVGICLKRPDLVQQRLIKSGEEWIEKL